MFLWFVGTAIATVRFVFQDPRFDYRLLIVGAVLPLLDLLFGRIARSCTRSSSACSCWPS